METARKLEAHYTYADYCTWPEDERWELINGVAYAMATPTEAHQHISIAISTGLFSFLRGKPCRVYAAPFSVRLNADAGDDTVVEPDILVVCDEKKLEGGKGVVGAPDLIVEILSPSTAKHDRIVKFDLYLHSGVREYWIVDPDSKTVSAHVLDNGRYYITRYAETDTAPVHILEGCTIDLAEVFEGLPDNT